MSKSNYVDQVKNFNNLTPDNVAKGFTLTGGLAAGKLGLLIIKDGASTITKVVQADKDGHFTQALTAADTASFHADTMSVELQAISTPFNAAQLRSVINVSKSSIFYKVLEKVSEVVSVGNKIFIDANLDTYIDNTTLTPVKGMSVEIVNFNSRDDIPKGYKHVDQQLTINVGSAAVDVYLNAVKTELDIYIAGQSSHDTGAPSVVIKGAMGDVDADNITLVGTGNNYNMNFTGSHPSYVTFHNTL